MKKPYPSRAEDRWEHALTMPLTRRTPYETIELIRGDLFELLDVLTRISSTTLRATRRTTPTSSALPTG